MGRPAYHPEDVWRFVDRRAPHECWPWISTKSPRGYGLLGICGQQFRAVRIICWLRDNSSITLRAAGNSKDRSIVRHSCDNPACCNPAHLTVGKPKENTADMLARGRRHNWGGENGARAKLSNKDAQRIREARLFGADLKTLAGAYGVSVPTVSMVARGLIYRNA